MNGSPLFDFAGKPRLIGGCGCAADAGVILKENGVHRALIVTDPGVRAAGLCQRSIEGLDRAGVAWTVFDGVCENPTDLVVDACRDAANVFNADGFLAIGGGSAMDAAKGANFLLTNGGRIHDYRGAGRALKPLLPLVAVPTTTGTGSECQSFAIISDSMTGMKMAIGDRKAFPLVALLDPELTLTQPPYVLATSSLDALAHAIESMVARNANPLSHAFSRESFVLLGRGLNGIGTDENRLEAHRDLQLGSALAGMAIELSMLGAAHALANPVTARFHLAHGAAVALMLPTVMVANEGSPGCAAAYADLAKIAGLENGDHPGALAIWFAGIRDAAGLPNQLPEGAAAEIEALAIQAAHQWTMGFNPVTFDAPGCERLYRSVG